MPKTAERGKRGSSVAAAAKPRRSRAVLDDPNKPPPKPAHRTPARPGFDDLFLAMDFHLREGERNRAKTVATRWDLTERTVRRIASRGRFKCAKVLADMDCGDARAVVEMQRRRILLGRRVPEL
jgi:hypothetical protein